MGKSGEVTRSNSWYGGASLLRCPVPDCGHRAVIITKAHCRLAHNMERTQVKAKYGFPFKVDTLIRKK